MLRQIEEVVYNQSMNSTIADLLKKNPVFKDLQEEILEKLISLAKPRKYAITVFLQMLENFGLICFWLARATWWFLKILVKDDHLQ